METDPLYIVPAAMSFLGIVLFAVGLCVLPFFITAILQKRSFPSNSLNRRSYTLHVTIPGIVAILICIALTALAHGVLQPGPKEFLLLPWSLSFFVPLFGFVVLLLRMRRGTLPKKSKPPDL